MSKKKQAQKAKTSSARANQTRPNRPNRQTSTETPVRKRKPLTQEQRDRKNAKDRARRAAAKAAASTGKTAHAGTCCDCGSCSRLDKCRKSARTDGYPQVPVSRPPALPPSEGRPEPVSAPVPRRLGPPQAVVVPISGAPCRLGVAQPVYAASRDPHPVLQALLDLALRSLARQCRSASSCQLPVRPFRLDVCDIVERRNVEIPEEGWE